MTSKSADLAAVRFSSQGILRLTTQEIDEGIIKVGCSNDGNWDNYGRSDEGEDIARKSTERWKEDLAIESNRVECRGLRRNNSRQHPAGAYLTKQKKPHTILPTTERASRTATNLPKPPAGSNMATKMPPM